MIAFPKTAAARALFEGAPHRVPPEDLDLLAIRVTPRDRPRRRRPPSQRRGHRPAGARRASTTPTCSSWRGWRACASRCAATSFAHRPGGGGARRPRWRSAGGAGADGRSAGPRQRSGASSKRAGPRRRRAARNGDFRIVLPGLRRIVAPKTAGQRAYVQAMLDNDIVVGIGPAGTGKTYLAVAAAVDMLHKKRVQADHPRAARRRGGRVAGVPAGRHAGQGRSLPAAAVRRARGHDAARAGAARPRDAGDRDRAARVHARPHARRRLRHSRRGPERHGDADEDVPHPPRA